MEKSCTIEVTSRVIENKIISIRGQQVMVDSDLAELYGVKTKRLNEAVKRNLNRFPCDFMFQLTSEELLRSQFATSNEKGGRRYNPYAFTENGIAMLSSVLRSDTAIEVNIRIMRAFTAMRQFLATNVQVMQRIETMEFNQLEMKQHQTETDHRVDEIFKQLDSYKLPKQGVFFDGQVYDAYVFFSNLITSTKVNHSRGQLRGRNCINA